MKGSLKIFQLFDIPVRIHWSFMLIFVLLFYYGASEGWNWISIVWSVTLVLSLFFCVICHEFGHALTARVYGVSTKDIILLPIGGLARLDRLPEKPIQEFLVAIAGPLVNVGIVCLLAPYLLFFIENGYDKVMGIFNPYSNVFIDDISALDSFIIGLVVMNSMLAVFNLIPAFPMDGGRVLRALLSLPFGRLKATRIASYIGQFLAILLIVESLFRVFWPDQPPSVVSAFVGFFVFFMARNEYRMIRIESLLKNHKVSDIIRTHYTRFYLDDDLEKVKVQFEKGMERSFLVFDELQNLRGVLSENTLLPILKKRPLNEPVSQHLNVNYEILLPDDSLSTVLYKMQRKDYFILPVYEYDQLLGVIDRNMVNNFIRIKEKMK